MLKGLKRFYWQLLASKGKMVFWILRSVVYQFKTQILTIQQTAPNHKLPNNLIVSLTSFPPRFKKLHLTLKCLLNQDTVPDKIILWVAENDFKLLPNSVIKLQKHNDFEIQTCEDLKSGKKIIPSIELYPSSFVVTADDDLFYSREWLSELCGNWDGNNNHIYAHRVHHIRKIDEVLVPYQNWDFDIKSNLPSPFNFATGCGGVLYPPNSLNSMVLDKELYMRLCPKQDDIWLYWMAQLNGSQVINTPYQFQMIPWLGSEKSGLASENLSNKQNDKCINKMMAHYGWPN